MTHPESQFALPFAERDEVSVRRTMKIFGVSRSVVLFLIEKKLIRAFRKHETGNYFISYQSIVEYCDKLREKYHIEDTRPKRGGIFGRYRDEELMPFSLAEDTMTIAEVADVLRYAEQTVRHLCEEGKLLSYKVHDDGLWRISKRSLQQLCERMRSMAS